VMLLCAAPLSHAGQERTVKPKTPPVKNSDPPAEVVNVGGVEPASRPDIAEVLDPDPTPEIAATDAPRADISADGEIALNCWLLLDASISRNPLGAELEFSWRQSAGPALAVSPAELKRPKLWLFLSNAGEYRWTLRVKNANGWSAPAERKFSVKAGRS